MLLYKMGDNASERQVLIQTQSEVSDKVWELCDAVNFHVYDLSKARRVTSWHTMFPTDWYTAEFSFFGSLQDGSFR